MGLGVTRQGDQSAGACGCPPTAAVGCSSDVMANKRGVVRMGDAYAVHSGALPPHAPTAMAKANKVFANKKLVHRQTDPLSCGDLGNTASTDVFAG